MIFGNEYLKINENLYLTEYSFNSLDSTLGNTLKKKNPTNHIWIYDRSGSMWGLLDKLIEDLISRAKKIPIGDTITFGWFSSEGQHNFILKGFKVTDKKDYSLLEKALRSNNYTLGCTCFSEILYETEQVIQDLSIFSSNFAFAFFTDGYPIVSSYDSEIKSIYNAVERLNSKVTAALFVGYGDYYNKQLMAEMAEKIGGSLTHSANLASFSITLDSFIDSSLESKKIAVKIDSDVTPNTFVFNINGTNINLYSVDKNNEVKMSCGENEKTSLYVLTDVKPKGKEIKVRGLSKKLCSFDTELNFLRACYASAYILTQRTKTDIALDILGFIGDKKLIDLVTNSYTNAEYGKAEENIKDAVFVHEKRFLEGKVKNYVPPADAFCFLDLVDLLSEDDDAYFYPRHEKFVYKKIGRPSVQEENYPKFNANKDTKSSFTDVVWNETKLNLSMRAVVRGTIDLPAGDASKYGLVPSYPTFQYKNYTFIKDGILNITEVPASMSEATFNELIKKGILADAIWEEDIVWEKDRIYTLCLDVIPIVNRKIAEGKTSATELCKLVLEEQKLKATLKAIKWYYAQEFPEKELSVATAKTFIEKQQAFLESVGINTKTGAFEPPTKTAEATDFYMSKEFAVKVKGLSSLPKIEVVAEKLKANKKLTSSDTLVATGVTMYTSEKFASEAAKKEWFEKTIASLKEEIKKVRRKVQETKFSVLLGKRWFSEFTSREDNKLTIDGYEFTISLTENKVCI